MAKRENTVAIPAARVWQAMRSGSLNLVMKIGGTPILKLTGRIQYGWQDNGTRRESRVRLNGKYLVPRWINLPTWYPIDVENLVSQDEAKLAQLGFVRVDNQLKLLIYQQLDDLHSALRQQNHILANYETEYSRYWSLLGANLISDDLTQSLLKRLGVLSTVSSHIAARAGAIRNLLQSYIKTTNHLHKLLTSKRQMLAEPENHPNIVIGVLHGLPAWQDSIEPLLSDPIHAAYARLVIYQLGKTHQYLALNQCKKAVAHIDLAIKHLEKIQDLHTQQNSLKQD